jgi:hypothetical protein
MTLRELQRSRLAEAAWNGPPEWVRAPYAKDVILPDVHPSTTAHVERGGKPQGPPCKAKYSLATDSEQVP